MSDEKNKSAGEKKFVDVGLRSFWSCVGDYVDGGARLAKATHSADWGEGPFRMAEYVSDDGAIRFGIKDGEMFLHFVEVNEELRGQGRFSRFIQQAMAKFPKISVAGVGSPILMIALNKRRFYDHGGDFIWAKDGKCCDKSDCHRQVCYASLYNLSSKYPELEKIGIKLDGRDGGRVKVGQGESIGTVGWQRVDAGARRR